MFGNREESDNDDSNNDDVSRGKLLSRFYIFEILYIAFIGAMVFIFTSMMIGSMDFLLIWIQQLSGN
jgi:hypothetical protein